MLYIVTPVHWEVLGVAEEVLEDTTEFFAASKVGGVLLVFVILSDIFLLGLICLICDEFCLISEYIPPNICKFYYAVI